MRDQLTWMTDYFASGNNNNWRFHFHFDDTNDVSVHLFTGQLDAHGLGQHVTGANHMCGHVLDVALVL